MNQAEIQRKFTYTQATGLYNQLKWEVLGDHLLHEAAQQFLEHLKPHTKRSYGTALNLFFTRGILDPTMDLQKFSLLNLETILDKIRQEVGSSEATRQARAAAFISFTTFLTRRTGGMVKRVAVNRCNTGKTFSKIRDKAHTKALDQVDWDAFISTLKERSERDALIAQALLQGAKRIDEVLSAKIEDVDFSEGSISFYQSKSDRIRQTVVFFSVTYLTALKRYLGDRTSGLIFISRNGRKLIQSQIWGSFKAAGGVHPHQLRTTGVTWMLSKGFAAESVQKVSGHSSVDAVMYYDKSSIKDNPTRKISLI
jgi:integrase/recombinase XerD